MGVTGFTRPVQLDAGMALDGFRSGAPLVDDWLARRARTAKARGGAVVYVSHAAGADVSVDPPAGFYALSISSVGRDAVGGGWLGRGAPGRIPVILIGVLGVDERYQGHGLGRMLLHDAAVRALAAADAVGAKALVVDPLDAEAERFYERNGFAAAGEAGRMHAPLSGTAASAPDAHPGSGRGADGGHPRRGRQ